jgi:hypothetical protein
MASRARAKDVSLAHLFLALGVLLTIVGLYVFCVGSVSRVAWSSYPYDFNVNWIAAHRLVDGQAIYDRTASTAQAVASLGPTMGRGVNGPFVSFIGPPSTALLHVPFLALSHRMAVLWFRLIAVVGIIGSLALTSRVLPRGARLGGFLLGLGAALASFPLAHTIALGQGHEFVMLGLALGTWGSARRRWGVAGIGLGVAAVLKVSPALLVVYLVARGHRRPAWWAAGTAVVLSAAAALVGRPSELWTWFRDVAPDIGRGSLHVFNQAVVGWLARLSASGNANFLVQSVLDRRWQVVAYLLAAVLLIALWRKRRNQELIPLELGIVVLVALAAGPLTWDHYLVWAFIPFTLCFDPTLWLRRSRRETRVLVGLAALAIYLYSVPLSTAWNASRGTAWLPWITSLGTVATIIVLTMAWRLITPRTSTRHAEAPVSVVVSSQLGTP